MEETHLRLVHDRDLKTHDTWQTISEAIDIKKLIGRPVAVVPHTREIVPVTIAARTRRLDRIPVVRDAEGILRDAPGDRQNTCTRTEAERNKYPAHSFPIVRCYLNNNATREL